jgi:MFS family permease
LTSHNFNRFLSVIVHPILYPLLATLVFLYFTPRYFPVYTQYIFLSMVLIGTIAFPLLILGILKKSKLIESFHLSDQSERKTPLIVFTLMALMMSRVFFKLESSYDLGVYFIAGSMSFLIAYWFLWLRYKLSLHTMGLGSFLGFILQLSLNYHLNYLLLIGSLFVFFGIIAKARIELGAHNFKETIWGFVMGILPQLLIPFLYQNI